MNDLSARILIYEKNGNGLKPIKIYRDNEGRQWVEARNGTKFVIEVKNNSYEKILSVISVDGLSVLTGKRAVIDPSNGYVVNAFSNLKINGWRTSLSQIREFVFTNNKKETFSAKLGAEENNIGVIGFAFFKQKTPYFITTGTNYPLPSLTWNLSDYNTATPTAYNTSVTSSMSVSDTSFSASPKFRSMSMGTKQGESKEDVVKEVSIEFEQQPFIVDKIYYDSRENLIAKGIIKKEKELPEPFANEGFCPSL